MHREIYLQLKDSLCCQAEDAYKGIQEAVNAKKIDDDFFENCKQSESDFITISSCLQFCQIPFASYLAELLAQICTILKAKSELSTDDKWDISYSSTVFIAYLNNVGLWNSELPVVIFEAVYLLEKILKKDLSDGGKYIPKLADAKIIKEIDLSNPQKEPDIDTNVDIRDLFATITSDLRNNKNYYTGADKLSNIFLYLSSHNYHQIYRVIFFLAAHLFDLVGSDFIKVNKTLSLIFDQLKMVLDDLEAEEKINDFDPLLKNIAFLVLSCSTRSAAAKKLIDAIGYKPYKEGDINVIKSFTTKDDLDLIKTIFMSLYQNIDQVISEYKENGASEIPYEFQAKIKETYNVLKVVKAESFFQPLESFIGADIHFSEELISCLSYLNSQIELFIESPDLDLFYSAEIDVIDKEVNRRICRECLLEIRDVQDLLIKVDQQRLPPEVVEMIPDHINLAMQSSKFLPFDKVTDVLFSLKVFFSNFQIDFDVFPYPQYANDIADVLYSVYLFFENYSNNFNIDYTLLEFAQERLERNNLCYEYGIEPEAEELNKIELRCQPFSKVGDAVDDDIDDSCEIDATRQAIESILSLPETEQIQVAERIDSKPKSSLMKYSLVTLIAIMFGLLIYLFLSL